MSHCRSIIRHFFLTNVKYFQFFNSHLHCLHLTMVWHCMTGRWLRSLKGWISTPRGRRDFFRIVSVSGILEVKWEKLVDASHTTLVFPNAKDMAKSKGTRFLTIKKVDNNSKTIDGPPYLVHGAPEDVWRAVEFVPGLRLEAGPAMKTRTD